MLVNSQLAVANMPCEMDMPNDTMDHSQHDMAAMDMSATSMDCCDHGCLCEMSCGSYYVLLDSESNTPKLTSANPIGFYLSSIPNAVQGKIFHPPIQT
ncbi:MAG: hypothetical protein JKY88_08120 [Pseudomonadales bacterium]|nr:hypothetical protein [Pseudomonadales bacterium]